MNGQSMIEIYQAGFYVCLGIAVLGLVLTIIFFFAFRIPSIWALRTGRAQKQAVGSMRQASRKDGRMRKEEQGRILTTEEMVGESAEVTAQLEAITEEMSEGGNPTTLLEQTAMQDSGEYAVTMLLQPQEEANVDGRFTITQEVILIHTTEMIPE